MWRLRQTQSKYTPALVGIIVLFILNFAQTSEHIETPIDTLTDTPLAVLTMMVLYEFFIVHGTNPMSTFFFPGRYESLSAAQELVH